MSVSAWQKALQPHLKRNDYRSAQRILDRVKPLNSHQRAIHGFFQGEILFGSGLINESIPYFRGARKHAMDSNERYLAARSTEALAHASYALGDLDSCEAGLREAISLYESEGRRHEIIDAEQDVANVLMSRGRFREAEKLVWKGIRYHFLRLKREGLSSALQDAAILYSLSGHRFVALGLSSWAILMARNGERPQPLLFSMISYGSGLKNSGNLVEARKILEDVLDKARRLRDLRLEGAALANIADIDCQQGHLDEAELNAQTAKDAFVRIGFKEAELKTLGLIGSINEARGDFGMAERHYRAVLSEAARLGIDETMKNGLRALRSLMEHLDKRQQFNELLASVIRAHPGIAGFVPPL